MSKALKTVALIFIMVVSYNHLFIPQVKAEYHSKRVLTVGVNPVENGESVVSKFWGNATNIENIIFNTAISGFNQASGGNINYTIVNHLTVSEFPRLPNGQPVFNMESYTKCVSGGSPSDIQNCDNSKWQFDYSKFFDDYGICTAANNANADEIWMVTPPYIGKFESFFIGPYQGFWINGEAVVNSNCNKLYPVMGPTYDRQDTLMHNFGHRFESTFEYLFSNINDSERNSHWRRFSGFGGQALGCGNTHFPANARFDYDYGNYTAGVFKCPDWKNFPNYTGATITVSCTSWGCNDPGWESFWFSYIPSASGDAILHNTSNSPLYMKKDWWYYLLNPAQAIDFVNYTYNPGPVSCNYSYSDWGNCSAGTQTRSVTATDPQGCSGGEPQLSQSCTMCYSYTYSAWGECINGTQKRTLTQTNESSCPGEQMGLLERPCTVVGNTIVVQNENGEEEIVVPEDNSSEPNPVLPQNINQTPTSFTLEGILNTLFGRNTENSDPNSASYPITSESINQHLVGLIVILAVVSGGLLTIILFLYSGGIGRFRIKA